MQGIYPCDPGFYKIRLAQTEKVPILCVRFASARLSGARIARHGGAEKKTLSSQKGVKTK
ncbi:MAG: hypothetical protein A2X49_07300 [Lentisphaerae bacterium GWF2_52_8]|nr:MAG: hypothetical protein A2X49_07300 [Lentisphaerae bacterium GWF2_52_8]